jgi:hypothetical protein
LEAQFLLRLGPKGSGERDNLSGCQEPERRGLKEGRQEMRGKSPEQIATEVLDELGLTRWRIQAVDWEPEEEFSPGEGKPECEISTHLRFHFGYDERSFEVIRLRLDPEDRRDAARRDAFIRNGLRERLKQLNNIR